MCSDNKAVETKCQDLPNPTLSWKDLIGVNLSATFNFKPITEEMGVITIGMLGNADKILTDRKSIRIEYKDGTKYTINKSWFE